ncbi:MAG: hypothetical protein JF886_02400 [Candidatus Dormibacteraeota bacterium]|uniref:Bacterial Ig-like domain-containing protein n=1 Tax=Candidatus Aeolococcus gillhamiae TaxID=3127015 RepID=A0A2W5ZDR4_9BACT|nr:hypothetical protein [Candidatus Dormibacteraeota bacterium]PZR80956.1 MAG: hypothetical protein DLM65_07230 [Candidatus Dormibacter sp. RRmetagenome_bin12]
MTRGDARHSSGRKTSIGRRLRVGAAGTIAAGGAILLGGAVGVITASAHSGSVTGSETCTGWSVSVDLAHNVTTDRNVDVITTIPGTTSIEDQHFDSSYGNIWKASGSSPVSGTVSLRIDRADDATQESGPPSAGYSVTLSPPSQCVSDISTDASAGGPVGTTIHDSATVSGTAGSPAGTVLFKLFPPSNASCNGDGAAAVYTATVALTSVAPGKSKAVETGSFTTTAVGTYHWWATYRPAAGSPYTDTTSTCDLEPVTISKAAPSIATTAGAGGVVPINVTDSATVSGGSNPTGTVTFTLYPSVADCNAGTNAVTGSTSTATLSAAKAMSGAAHLTTAGTYQWIAKYSGDANNAGLSSKCGDEPVTTTSGGGGGVQAITTPSTGVTDSLTSVRVGGFLLLGGLGAALAGVLVPRRRRSQ